MRLFTPRQTMLGGAALLRSGLVRVYRPEHLARIATGWTRYQMGPGMGATVGAAVYPAAVGVVDDSGPASMRELDARCTAVAHDLAGMGLAAGHTVGILLRNSSALYEVAVGASRLGLDVVYLNTGFTAAQIGEIARRHDLRALVYDEEFTDRLPHDVMSVPATATPIGGLPGLSWDAAREPPRLPALVKASRHVILTSGTTGSPKGVARTGGGIESIIAMLSGLPVRVRQTHLIAAPMFHGWGWLHMMLTMLLSSTIVVTRRFDPERTLALLERERCHVLVAVPAMLARIMDLSPRIRRRYDVSCLRLVAVSGSALSGRLAQEFMDEFGDVLYNLYGSTEVGFATVATPGDLRAAPGTAGRPLPTVRVRVVDARGRPCPPYQPGSIQVGGRDTVRGDGRDTGPASTGDVGWFDEAGRLFVGARADDMIIVGGENLYPVVVEHALEHHPDIVEAAVVDAPDRVLGQVVVAHVALRRGATATPEAIRTWARSHLATFQVPRRVVIHDRLPHNETGKVDKLLLRGGRTVGSRDGGER